MTKRASVRETDMLPLMSLSQGVSKMEYHLKKTYFSGQATFITNRGDELWEAVCDEFEPDEHFTREDVTKLFMREFGWTRRSATSRAYAFVANCVAMEEGGLFKVGPRELRFHDANGA